MHHQQTYRILIHNIIISCNEKNLKFKQSFIRNVIKVRDTLFVERYDIHILTSCVTKIFHNNIKLTYCVFKKHN